MADFSRMTDAELVGAVNGGDWAAFEALYFRHRDWVLRLAQRFCGDGGAEDAQDVVQEVFIYLAGKFPGLELRAGLTTLLYPAVKHTALALRRKRRRVRGLSEESLEDLTAPPEAREPGAKRGELAEALGGSPEAHREVLLMRFVDDMSLEEIAGALAIPLGTAKSRLHHALKHLREDPRTRSHFGS